MERDSFDEICIKNKNLKILNSQTFIITNVNNNEIKYQDHKTEYTLNVNEFNRYFYLGFCITVYASQGETFDQKYTSMIGNIKDSAKKQNTSLCQEEQISTISKSHNNLNQIFGGPRFKLYPRNY